MYDKKLGVLFGYREVFDQKAYTLEQMVQELKEFDVDAAIGFCSTILLILSADETKKMGLPAHRQLAKTMLFDDELASLDRYLASRDGAAIESLFNDQVVIAVMKLNLEHNNSGGRLIDTKEDRSRFAKIIFTMNTHWLAPDVVSHGRRGDSKGIKENIRISQTLQFLNLGNEPLVNLMTRGNFFVKQMAKNKTISFSDEFKKATGIDIDNYLDMVFLIALGWTTVTMEAVPNNIYKDANTYFSKLLIPPDQIKKFIELLSFSYEDYAELSNRYNQQVGLASDSLYNVITFIIKPLYRKGNLLACLSPYYLILQLVDGPYNVVREALKGTENGDLLPDEWGKVYEDYVKDILVNTFGKKCSIDIIDAKGSKSIDAVVELTNCVLLLEIKYPHWKYKARITGRRDYVRDFVLRFARYKPRKENGKLKKSKKGFGQIKDFLMKYDTGQLKTNYDFKGKRLIPIVVLGEQYPFDPFNRILMTNHIIDQDCYIDRPDTAAPIILNSEEMEMIESFVEAKGDKVFEDTMMYYASSMDKTRIPGTRLVEFPTTFKNMVHEFGFSFGNNSRMRKSFDAVSERVKTYFRDGEG